MCIMSRETESLHHHQFRVFIYLVSISGTASRLPGAAAGGGFGTSNKDKASPPNHSGHVLADRLALTARTLRQVL